MPPPSLTWVHCTDGLDWEELAELYRVAPLGVRNVRNVGDLKLSFGNSMYVSFAYNTGDSATMGDTLEREGDIQERERGRLVAAGRVLADGVDCAYVCDIAVHPDMQGTGTGKALVSGLVSMCKHHAKVILYAAPGKEGFYRKFGFRPMTTAMAIFKDDTAAVEGGYLEPPLSDV
ncbi:hypothetical protein KIPB_006362 [Kipferlia bialata]|uniref:N-acetyltransferase domain-containing protein n=1 Tax=Kipferlia bialata TaxID=797122 RepID=A0A391NM96_9EUKA|nr:hypothetical protein KIPB_006362 [Kipferlia bialata]|eukprot:g6362.t1